MITLLIITAAFTALSLYLITRNPPVVIIHEPSVLDRLLEVDARDWVGYNTTNPE